ncbi:hypothetical protein H4Q26_013301 [Puccinia striiformis f. sp. tritici PST-130]|nr:hypothetical protein H4Q26_013301 [Puccinia striiformis f. sp. tritici PST-130]
MRSEGDQASIPTDGAQAISVQVESSRRRIQELSEALKEEQSKLERLEALERTLQTFSQPQSNISLESQTEEDPNNNGGGDRNGRRIKP